MMGLISFSSAVGSPCDLSGGGFLSFPHWYKYLNGVEEAGNICSPRITGINDVWLILAAVLEILLRIAALAAIVFVVWGAIQMISGQGEPENYRKARQTVINALVGLVISVGATAFVSFIAGRF